MFGGSELKILARNLHRKGEGRMSGFMSIRFQDPRSTSALYSLSMASAHSGIARAFSQLIGTLPSSLKSLERDYATIQWLRDASRCSSVSSFYVRFSFMPPKRGKIYEVYDGKDFIMGLKSPFQQLITFPIEIL